MAEGQAGYPSEGIHSAGDLWEARIWGRMKLGHKKMDPEVVKTELIKGSRIWEEIGGGKRQTGP